MAVRIGQDEVWSTVMGTRCLPALRMEAEIKRCLSSLWVVPPLFMGDVVCPALASVAVLLAAAASVAVLLAVASWVAASVEVWSVSAWQVVSAYWSMTGERALVGVSFPRAWALRKALQKVLQKALQKALWEALWEAL